MVALRNLFDIHTFIFLQRISSFLIVITALLAQDQVNYFKLCLLQRFINIELALLGQDAFLKNEAQLLEENVDIVNFLFLQVEAEEDFLHDLLLG